MYMRKTPSFSNQLNVIIAGVKRSLLSLFVAVIVLTVTGCNKDDFNPDLLEQTTWSPEVAFPLVYTEMGISDLTGVNDSNTTIITDPDQFCTLIYHGRAFELSAAQLAPLPDQYFNKSYGLSNSQLNTLGLSGQVTITKSQLVDFSVSQGMEIDSITFKDGTFDFGISSDFPVNATVILTIASLQKNGVPLTSTMPLNYSGSTPVTASSLVSLTGYKCDFTNGGTTHNQLKVDYTITFSGMASGVSTSNRISFNPVFRGLKFQSLFGYAGQQSIANIKDSIEISIFNNSIGSGTFTIAEPKIRFDISNSLGLPISARVTQLLALNGNLTNFVVATGVPDPLPVGSPNINQIGQTVNSTFTLDHNNSNINALIGQQPKYLITQTQATTNPAGHTINFLLDSSKIAVDVHVELPFYGTANNFKVKDTVPFSYNDLADVQDLLLRMELENGFPLESSVQLIFTDENLNPLDTMFTANEVVIPSGIVAPGDDRVSLPGRKVHDQHFDQLRIQKILSAKNIVVVASATSMNDGNTNVRIYADYKMKIKIGAIAKMKIQ